MFLLYLIQNKIIVINLNECTNLKSKLLKLKLEGFTGAQQIYTGARASWALEENLFNVHTLKHLKKEFESVLFPLPLPDEVLLSR